VSLANFAIWLPGVIDFMYPVLTTYDGGPLLEPWIILAVMSDIVNSFRRYCVVHRRSPIPHVKSFDPELPIHYTTFMGLR